MSDNRWFVLDGLQSQHRVSDAPGINDSSTVVLVLVADDKVLM